jgi:hypothetical protein
MDPAFVFPFRPETLPVLEWAASNSDHWVWTYLLALNLWGVDRDNEAATHMEALGDTPDFGPMYVARAQLLAQARGSYPMADLQRAVALDPGSRILHIHLIRLLEESADWDGALAALRAARDRFPGDFELDLLQARALINVGRGLEATRILASTRVLPSENARESHRLYEQAHTLAALDALKAPDAPIALDPPTAPDAPIAPGAGAFAVAKDHLMAALLWPESLGQGRPYRPEERLVRFLLGRVEGHLGNEGIAAEAYQSVLEGTGSLGFSPAEGGRRAQVNRTVLADRLDLLAISALHALGRTSELEALARNMATDTEVGRFAERFAAALAWGSGDAGEAARQLEGEFPYLFDDLEGRILLRALTLKEPPGASREPGRGVSR